MPRPKSPVKNKLPIQSLGAIDLHFHGAFGIDLMRAETAELDELSIRLRQGGVAGFCPTTLTASPAELQAAVERLGRWIAGGKAPGAMPLGIHLEGPFISPKACGAHLPGLIRPLSMKELETLWTASGGTLKILTIAPETLRDGELADLATWASRRKIRLSLGHSQATEIQAAHAFDQGFSGVTHAWNALPFHHRSPGPLGAALGRANTHVEVIIDRIHVDPTLIRWTLALHPDRTCFVSDCAPAACTAPGSWHSFGPLKVQLADGAARVSGGHLAGGGLLLSEQYRAWAENESRATDVPALQILKRTLRNVTTDPLAAIGVSPRQFGRQLKLKWKVARGGTIQFDSVR